MKIQGTQGYNSEEAKVLGEGGAKLPAGNYICKIIGVTVKNSSKGNPMLVLQFDIDKGEHKNFYQNQFKNATYENPKYRGEFYQGMTGASLPFYKGVLVAIEKSNNIKLDGENGFDSEILKGKLFLGRFAEEEYAYNNEIKTITKIKYVTSADKENELPVLNKIELEKGTQMKKETDNFYTTETNTDEDNLPF